VGEKKKSADGTTTTTYLDYPKGTRLKGFGNFKLDFLVYHWFSINFSTKSNSMINTLELPPKIISPFLVMILFSLITPRNKKEGLDRYYAKMITPVDPDPEIDQKNLEEAYADLESIEQKKLFPGSSLEFQKPTKLDVIGFLVCFLVCFAIIGVAVLLANIVF